MHTESINNETKRVLEKIAREDFIQNFYLAGGTALAVQLGHRESIDLDWFSDFDFKNIDIKHKLSQIGGFSLTSEEEGTVNGVLDSVKVSFFYYDYKQIFPLVNFVGIKIADERDIAAMKIDAISSRGSKKDFIDLYFLLKKYSLEELVSFFEKKYSGIKYNRLHILKSLAYFEDAEDEPMPVMLVDFDWEKAKEKIRADVNGLV